MGWGGLSSHLKILSSSGVKCGEPLTVSFYHTGFHIAAPGSGEIISSGSLTQGGLFYSRHLDSDLQVQHILIIVISVFIVVIRHIQSIYACFQ